MVLASYNPTTFERALASVIIIAVIVVMILFHIQFIRSRIKERKITERGKSIFRMVIGGSIFWILGGFLIWAGAFLLSYYGIPIAGEGAQFFQGIMVFAIIMYLGGAFLFCLGTVIGCNIAFKENK